VTFSIDGWDNESNNKYRVNSEFDSIINGIKVLRTNSPCYIKWSTIYFKFNQLQIDKIIQLAKELGMSSLIEVHTHDELERALEISPEIIGVNSRNLKTLDVDSAAFAQLIPRIPTSMVRVAESGISNRSDVEFAQEHGATAILVGEALVRSSDTELAMRELRGHR
jgi:indole-3-glycerol phosphate synthase